MNVYGVRDSSYCYGARNEVSEAEESVATKKIEGCSANSDNLIQANLDVPLIPPTDTSSCIVKSTYYLRVRI